MTSSTPATPPTGPAQAETFHPDRAHILAAILLSGIALLGIGWMPWYVWWLFILPIIFIFWILRSKTEVSESGVNITNAFTGTTRIPWEKFKGVEFKGSGALAVTQSGTKHRMPGVTFNSLPRLAAASRGRIPDALTAAQEAADEKVVVIHRDGQQVLLTREEYEAHKAENGTA